MRLSFDISLSEKYNSAAQKIRVMSESWLCNNMYCSNCGNPRIAHLTNNSPVADFQCDNCGEIYELKSKNGNLGKKNCRWCIFDYDRANNKRFQS